jgi:hypothetical protein
VKGDKAVDPPVIQTITVTRKPMEGAAPTGSGSAGPATSGAPAASAAPAASGAPAASSQPKP